MSGLLFWHWWILGFGLLAVEVLVSGFFCLWLGLAALVTGLIVWLFPSLAWQVQVTLDAVLSLVAVGLWMKFKPLANQGPDSGLNERGKQHLGQVYTLVEPIVNGVGKAKVQDSVWRVSGPELAAGARVKVVAVDGTMLVVEPV